MRPLARVGALREPPAERVQRVGRPRAGSRARGGRRAGRRSVLLEVALLLECLVSRRVGLPLGPSHGQVERRQPGPSAPVRTASAASASSASRWVAGRRRCRARRARPRDASPGRPRPARAARARARSRRARRRSARRARGTGCSSRRRPSARRWSTPPRRRAKTDGTRTGASRLSWPQQMNAPGPVLGHDAVVGVEARRGQAAEAREVLEHAGDERARLGREPVGAPAS